MPAIIHRTRAPQPISVQEDWERKGQALSDEMTDLEEKEKAIRATCDEIQERYGATEVLLKRCKAFVQEIGEN